MADPFYSARRRIERAKQCAENLKARTEAFVATKPYTSVSEADLQQPEIMEHKVKFVGHLPDEISDITMEAISAIREALDHAAYAVATRKTHGGTSFAFGQSAADFEGQLKTKSENIPDEIKAVFRSFQPYRGGDDLLWTLNELCNTKKHRLVVPTGWTVGSMNAREISGDNILSILVPRWNSEKNEIVFARTGPRGRIKYDCEFRLGIAFGGVVTVSGKPVLAVLRALTAKVEGIVYATEAEAKRIGII